MERFLQSFVWLVCYLIGSIPVGYCLARWWKGVDIRQYGSGNIGTMNVYRVLGPGAAVVVFLLDVLKGGVGVRLAAWVYAGHAYEAWAAVLGGLFAIAGHNWSIFLNFRGGKGVATSLGVLIGLKPLVALLSFAVWFVVLLIGRYASVASMAGGISAPLWMVLFRQPLPYLFLTIVGAALILLRHAPNLQRLWRGEEPKIGQRVEVKPTPSEATPTEPRQKEAT